jgi:hypothetical protein
MKIKHFNLSADWNGRTAGGLYLGFKIHDAIRLCDMPSSYTYGNLFTVYYHSIFATIGLLVFTINITINYNIKYEFPNGKSLHDN